MSGLRELLRKWQNKRDELAAMGAESPVDRMLRVVRLVHAITDLETAIARKAYEQEFGRKPIQLRRKKND